MADISSSLLIRFFEEAASSLSEYESDECLCSLPLQRKALLQVQLSCLARVVEEHNDDDAITVEQVQDALKELSSQQNVDETVKEAMNTMNDAARLAFCRLVLHDECRWDVTQSPPRTLNDGHTPMLRQDLVEYAGLCNGVVRLGNVQEHLRNGTKLFDDIEPKSPSPIFCQKRLERIQQLLLRAVGFEIEFGKKEIERYYRGNSDLLDDELLQLLNQLSSNMTVAITNASIDTTATQALSDQDKGGVTRVVSVSYSEKVVGSDGHEISTTSAPARESIRQDEHDEQQLSQLKMAKQAASLEQTILNELMSLSEEEREAKLKLARQTHEEFVTRAMELPAGPERIAFLTSVDPEKQQLLLIHKLWTSRSEVDGGNGKLK